MAAKVPAADQVLAILGHLARQAGPVPAATVARDLGLPRSTTYQLLAVLCEHGFVVHLSDERRYGLGVAAHELGTGFTRQAPLQRVARVPLAALVDRTGHTAHLAVLHGREGDLPDRGAGPGTCPAGDRRRRAAAGTAHRERPSHARGPAVRAGAGPVPGSAGVRRAPRCRPRSHSALRRLLVETRREGHAVEVGEVTPGFTSVAAAVLDHTAHPVAGVAVTYPERGGSPRLRDRVAAEVTRTARAISHRIGGEAGTPRAVGDAGPGRS